jgi:hypothetical protein
MVTKKITLNELRSLVKQIIKEEVDTDLTKMAMEFSPGTYIHYPNEKLLYRITKTSGDGPYANTYGIVYIGEENRAAEWEKNRFDIAKDVQSKKAFVLPKNEGQKLSLIYKK